MTWLLRRGLVGISVVVVFQLIGALALASPEVGMTVADVMRIQTCSGVRVSPDGARVAYLVTVPRGVDEEAGAAYSELHVLELASGRNLPFVTGKVNVRAPQWTPDGRSLGFLAKRGGNAHTQVWVISLDGGEARQVTEAQSDVLAFRFHPDGQRLLFVAQQPPSARDKELTKKGYGFVFFEENLRHRNLYLQPLAGGEVRQLTDTVTVWDFVLTPDGSAVVLSASAKNLVDHEYMFQQLYHVPIEAGGQLRQITRHQGKLGNFALSPDGRHVAYAGARDVRDHAPSQAWVMPVAGGEARNLTPSAFPGHVNQVAWRDNDTLLVHTSEGVWNHLRLAPRVGGEWRLLLDGRAAGVVVGEPSTSRDGGTLAFVGSTPGIPGEVFLWQGRGTPRQLTNRNPWLAQRRLGRQEVIRYPARDGQEIEGILVYPVGFEKGRTYPLVVSVHGGPEAHYSNGWLTRYLDPAQVLAARGYLAFYPNYRASTGYGVEFAMAGFGDPAGKEFDDIADGITHLVKKGLADPERVGVGGGSYGGYAAAWFATFYTKLVRAVTMFVGISDLVAKAGTTDIPWEDQLVHIGKPLEEAWDLMRQRSPIFWAYQSRTAVLILHGDADTRVHPSQSLAMYRRLKMNRHPATRLVFYPGEGHGNAKQTGRRDVLCRHLAWYDHYLRDAQPLEGPMPPLDVSDCYGLEALEEEARRPAKGAD